MRVVVLFDLPTLTPESRRSSAKFRQSLLNDGFDMLQYSVYSRLCANLDIAQKHFERVKRSSPKDGSIRVIYITEHQFSHMHIVVGEKTDQEKNVNTKQLAFF